MRSAHKHTHTQTHRHAQIPDAEKLEEWLRQDLYNFCLLTRATEKKQCAIRKQG